MKDVLETTADPVNRPSLDNGVLKVTTVVGSLTVLVFCVGWLITLRSDVNVMRNDIVQIKLSIQALNRVGELEGRLNELRQYGSDNARKNERDIADLRKEFELHKATTTKGTP